MSFKDTGTLYPEIPIQFVLTAVGASVISGSFQADSNVQLVRRTLLLMQEAAKANAVLKSGEKTMAETRVPEAP